MKKLLFILLSLSLLSSCSSSESKNDDASKTPKNNIKLVSSEVFIASGSEPNWSLEIDFTKKITLILPDNDTVTIPVQKVEINKGLIKLISATEKDNATITIRKGDCSVHLSDDFDGFIVDVKYDHLKFKGCGDYKKDITMDKRLIDLWLLESINGEKIKHSELNNADPILEIRSNSKDIDFNLGCNKLKGKFKTKGTNITFSMLPLTKRKCKDDIESIFLGNINKVDNFTISNNHLFLNFKETTLLTFKKID